MSGNSRMVLDAKRRLIIASWISNMVENISNSSL